MRANTGRDMLVKIEGTYHGHHDSLMFSVAPDPADMGPREHPVTVHQAMGIPQAFADLVRVVPFNDLEAARRCFAEHEGEIAGMIVEPAMMNCGVILPEPGYLQGLKDLCHANGAYLAFDEVKTGATLAYGGAVEAFGVVPDIVCLAKAIGGGTPCGAIGATARAVPVRSSTAPTTWPARSTATRSRWPPRRRRCSRCSCPTPTSSSTASTRR